MNWFKTGVQIPSPPPEADKVSFCWGRSRIDWAAVGCRELPGRHADTFSIIANDNKAFRPMALAA